MKYFHIFCLQLFFGFSAFSQNIGIGTASPDASARLDVSATNAGFLPPRMTTAQRDLIPSPVAGLVIYNNTTATIEFYNGQYWGNIGDAGAAAESKKLIKLYGGNQSDIINAIVNTPDGGYVIAGSSISSNNGTLSGITSNGSMDGWIIKVSSIGEIEWQKLLGGTQDDQFNGIAATPDGGFILAGSSNSSNTGTLIGVINNGNLSSDAWVVKINATGNTVWQKLYGGTANEILFEVVANADGSCTVAGRSSSSNTGTITGLSTNGGVDAYVMRLSNTGVIIWQKLLGGSNTDQAFAISSTADGGFLIGGNSASSNTGTLSGIINYGSLDFYIIKLNAAGVIVFQKLLGGTSDDECTDLQENADGTIIATGITSSANTGYLTGFAGNGGADGWVLKLDALANTFLFQRVLGGAGTDFFRSILQTPDGGYILSGISASANTGTITQPNSGLNDIYVTKINAAGNTEFVRLVGSSLNDDSRVLATNGTSGFVVGGTVGGSNSGFFTGYFVNGQLDGVLVKFDKYGNPL